MPRAWVSAAVRMVRFTSSGRMVPRPSKTALMCSSSMRISCSALTLPIISLFMVMTPLSRLRQNCKSGLPLRHVGRDAADVYYEHAQCLEQLAALRDDRGVGLRVHKDVTDGQINGLVLVDEVHIPALEVLGEALAQQAIVLRRQTDREVDLLARAQLTGGLHLAGDGEERQHEPTLVTRLVPHVRQPLAGECPETVRVLEHLIAQRRPHPVLGES